MNIMKYKRYTFVIAKFLGDKRATIGTIINNDEETYAVCFFDIQDMGDRVIHELKKIY